MKNTVYHYQLSQPDYINSIFPRSIHGWGRFSEAERRWLKDREAEFVKGFGYEEQPDGSFLQSVHSPMNGTVEPSSH